MDSLISGLGGKVAEEDGVVDLAAWMTFCAFDVMGEGLRGIRDML